MLHTRHHLSYFVFSGTPATPYQLTLEDFVSLCDYLYTFLPVFLPFLFLFSFSVEGTCCPRSLSCYLSVFRYCIMGKTTVNPTSSHLAIDQFFFFLRSSYKMKNQLNKKTISWFSLVAPVAFPPCLYIWLRISRLVLAVASERCCAEAPWAHRGYCGNGKRALTITDLSWRRNIPPLQSLVEDGEGKLWATEETEQRAANWRHKYETRVNKTAIFHSGASQLITNQFHVQCFDCVTLGVATYYLLWTSSMSLKLSHSLGRGNTQPYKSFPKNK